METLRTKISFKDLCAATYGYGWQTRLAEAFKLNPRTVRYWAAGKRRVPEHVMIALRILYNNKKGNNNEETNNNSGNT